MKIFLTERHDYLRAFWKNDNIFAWKYSTADPWRIPCLSDGKINCSNGFPAAINALINSSVWVKCTFSSIDPWTISRRPSLKKEDTVKKKILF